MGSNLVLTAIPLPGLRPDSLGDYLASLGLLRLLARKWPQVRMAWRDYVLHFVGGPSTLEELLDDLVSIADNRSWTPYNREWADEGKKGTRASRNLALWQAEAEEQCLELFAAHAVPRNREPSKQTRGSDRAAQRPPASYNKLLGQGGQAMRRDFSDGWKRAMEALAQPQLIKVETKEAAGKKEERKQSERHGPETRRNRKREELRNLLQGKPLTWMVENLNAASWFSDANRQYNSGQEKYREGQISPWAMVFACEGLPFWAGSASRRLGSMESSFGAFPFVSRAAAPRAEGEAGREKAEIWAPIWERPMTLPEVRMLFLRGRAEIGGRGVLTPSAFATAIVRRGVDAGVSEFFRFGLGSTTNAKTFEPRLLSDVKVQTALMAHRGPRVELGGLECVLDLINGLPAEKKGRRFVGLRGPLEAALVRVAERPNDPEIACTLVDTVVDALDKLDRNRRCRERGVSWKPLPSDWLPSLFGETPPGIEERLAMALVSSFPMSRPFALYRFGVERKGERFTHPKQAPYRWVWGAGELAKVLARVVVRRTFDWETSKKSGLEVKGPVRFLLPAGAEDVHRWLDGAVDDVLLARWVSRLALFDWPSKPPQIGVSVEKNERKSPAGPSLCLFGLFQPLFDLRPVFASNESRNRNILPPESGARTPGSARALARLIQGGQLAAALFLASSRYAMAAVPVAHLKASWRVLDSERLLASILFPIASQDRAMLVNRWLKPRRQQGDLANV